MYAIGVVRRIDDLGRIVIPEVVRQRLRIKEGDPFEIFVDEDGSIVLKPYHELSKKIEDLIELFKQMSTEDQKEIVKKLVEEMS